MQKTKKLIRKAELTRFMHSKLAERNGQYRSWIQVIAALMGMIVSVLAAIHYRFSNCQDGVFARDTGEKVGNFAVGELLLLLLILLPFLTTMLIILDATVWRFRDKEEEHRRAVGIWGNWIRKSGEVMENENIGDELKNIQRRYRRCMRQTPSTSTKKFIAYKKM